MGAYTGGSLSITSLLRVPITSAAALSVLTTALVATATPATAALPAGGMSAAALNTEFNAYGNTGGEWTSGDSTVSVPLPDGRNAWFFSDTLVGPVNPGGGLPANTPMINNSVVLQDGAKLVDTLHGGTAAAPKSLVQPPAGSGDRYWVGDGTVEGSTLRAVYQRMSPTGSGPLDFALVDSAVVTFALPGMTVTSVTDRGYGSRVAWGSAIVEDGTYTYIYGAEDAEQLRFAHLARVRSSRGLATAWQFWTGSTWSNSESASARLLSGVGAGFGVQKVGSTYVLVTQETNQTFSSDFVAYTATSPTGPFTGPSLLFTAPEPVGVPGAMVYDSRLHPELARSGKLLVSYNVNNLDGGSVYTDVTRYRPRFVEVGWPLPVPDPALVPAAPTGLTATPGSAGAVQLAWQAPAGTGLTYSIFERDVTAGQTHFTRVATGVSTTSRTVTNFYRTGHRYEFRVAAVNATGAGPQSATAAATVTIPAPAAPSGLTAVASDGGSITLNWTGVPNVWRYEVFRRDLDAGETQATRLWDPSPLDTTLTVTGLGNGHEYAFHVVAVHGGGTSAPSATVTETAFYSRPLPVTGLSAAAQADGTIRLNWSHVDATSWFWVYQRDVSAGETTFTKLAWPITTCCTMVAGGLVHDHEYEYQVAATSNGGESEVLETVSAIAKYPPPPAPTNLNATAQTDGTIKLTWSYPDAGTWFYIYQRDVTTGQTEYTKLAWPVTTCCTMVAGGLEEAHEYEFAVSALGGTGESVLSAPDTAIADFPPPPAPTGLQVVPGNGQVSLTWQGSADNWHFVEIRNVSAGQTGFTRTSIPVTTCCTMIVGDLTNGSDYQFRMVAAGYGGDSLPSNVVTARPVAPAVS